MAAIIRTVDLRGQRFDSTRVNELVPRAAIDISMAVEQIRPLLDDVRARGAEAVVEVTIARDGVDPQPLKVGADELAAALETLDPKLRAAIQTSIDRVRAVSEATLPTEVTVELADGAKVHQR